MGTRWRGMMAPLDTSTGDGRRFLSSGVSWRELPLALKWQRVDTMGHDDSVVIGLADQLNIGTVAEAVKQGWIGADAVAKMPKDMRAVWGAGEVFDDVDVREMPRLAEDVAEARMLTEKQVIGPSVDPGAVEAVYAEVGSDEPLTEERFEELLEQAWETGEEPPIELLFTEYQIAAATLVTVPAFEECRPFELLADEAAEPAQASAALVAAVSGATDLPVADRELAWDGDAAARRVFDACSDGDDVDAACVARAFLWRDPDADPATMGAYKLGFADMVDGELRIVPRGVAACAGGRGVDAADIPEDDKEAIRAKICTLYDKVQAEYDDWPDCPFAGDGDGDGDAAVDTAASAAGASAATVLALVAAAGPYCPAGYFEVPELAEVTPLTVTEPDEHGVRRVYGHVAAFGTCHTGHRDACVTPPTSLRGYADFHRYTATSDGRDLPVPAGRITVAHGALAGSCTCCRGIDDHACERLSMGAAIAHYDRARPVAWVAAGEDTLGIVVAGVIDPAATDEDLAALARQRVSGDWREVGGHLELVEVLTLAREKPGFPLPHTRLAHGRQVALVAAGTVRPRQPRSGAHRPVGGPLALDYERLGAVVADRLSGQLAGLLPAGTRLALDTTPLRPAGQAGETAGTSTDTTVGVTGQRGELVDRGALAGAVAGELLAEVDQAVQDGRAHHARQLYEEVAGV